MTNLLLKNKKLLNEVLMALANIMKYLKIKYIIK